MVNFFLALRMFLIGWPAYLALNTSGQPSDAFSSHFLPKSKIFAKDQQFRVTLSNWALVFVVGLLSVWIKRFGFFHFATRYLAPYLIVNTWLVFITYMQHTSVRLPHFDSAEWNYVRGALATTDRNLHFFDFFLHNIATTHIAHHLFSRIPFYHAQEASESLKKVLGEYYNYDSRNVFVAFVDEFWNCKFVDSDADGPEGVLWFKKGFKE